MESPEYFQYGRQIQSRSEQLDSRQHNQRAYCPVRSYGSLDRQRNDRLGRIQRQQLFRHRREILRAIANTNSDCNSDLDAYGDSYFDTYGYCNADS